MIESPCLIPTSARWIVKPPLPCHGQGRQGLQDEFHGTGHVGHLRTKRNTSGVKWGEDDTVMYGILLI